MASGTKQIRPSGEMMTASICQLHTWIHTQYFSQQHFHSTHIVLTCQNSITEDGVVFLRFPSAFIPKCSQFYLIALKVILHTFLLYNRLLPYTVPGNLFTQNSFIMDFYGQLLNPIATSFKITKFRSVYGFNQSLISVIITRD